MQNIFITIRYATEKKYQSHSLEYLTQIENKLIPNSLVASLKGIDLMKEINNKYNYGYTLGDYLFLMNKNTYPVNVGDLDTPMDSSSALNLNRSRKAIRDGIFYRYSQLPENNKMHKGEIMLKFLKQYNIQQMIVSKNAHIPDTLLYYVKKIITDTISSEKFVWLNL